MKKISFEEAVRRAERLCASQEKCTSDMMIRLGKWGLPDEEREKIIKRLKQNKFLDDARYALLFSRDKQKFNKWGKEKIRYELKKKDIGEEAIESAISQLDEDYGFNTLRELINKKKKEIKYSGSYELKAKLIRYGIRKGYGYDEVFRLVDEICKP